MLSPVELELKTGGTWVSQTEAYRLPTDQQQLTPLGETVSVWSRVLMDSVFPLSPLRCCSWAGPLSWTLCGDWRFQAGPWSLPPVTHFQRCTTSMTFIALQGRAVHLEEKTNKYGGCRSACVQTLLIWLSVSITPQHLGHGRHALRHDFDVLVCVQQDMYTWRGVCTELWSGGVIALADVLSDGGFCVGQFGLVLGNKKKSPTAV